MTGSPATHLNKRPLARCAVYETKRSMYAILESHAKKIEIYRRSSVQRRCTDFERGWHKAKHVAGVPADTTGIRHVQMIDKAFDWRTTPVQRRAIAIVHDFLWSTPEVNKFKKRPTIPAAADPIEGTDRKSRISLMPRGPWRRARWLLPPLPRCGAA